jgi:rhodanese-related sulfurtransferase
VTPRPLTIQTAIGYFQSGAALLDLRDKASFKEEHVPGAVHLELDDQLSNRIGFVLPPDVPVILLLPEGNEADDYAHAVYALARVGYDSVVGHLAESLAVWKAYGLPVTAGDVQDITPTDLNALLETGNGHRPLVVDVREAWEFAQGHVPGARLISLGELAGRVGELDATTPVALICATGSRSQSAAAILGQKGFETVYNVIGGTMRWMQNGLPLER